MTLFDENLTYEELEQIVQFLLVREERRNRYSSGPLLCNPVADYVVVRSLAPEAELNMQRPYNVTELEVIQRNIDLAPDCLKPRMQALLFDCKEMVAERLEEVERSKVKNLTIKAAEEESDDEDYMQYFCGA